VRPGVLFAARLAHGLVHASMIVRHRNMFVATCRQRGCDLAAAMACVVSQDGDRWTIDETHPAYPRAKLPPPPTLLEKVRHFASSATKHIAAGMPQATDGQVAARFAICQGCEHFDGTACRKCGCPVVRERKFLSKLSWANESCPAGKWGPV
jgi:hypothetical protein